jgi:hypothetical protein
VLICRVDDPATEQMTEVAAFDLPTPDVAILKPTTTLDDLETVTQRTGNAVLPPHHGIIITRGLQEWACLLPQELPFTSVARLLGRQTHEARILGRPLCAASCARMGRSFVRRSRQRLPS